jgi:hypothetical protein
MLAYNPFVSVPPAEFRDLLARFVQAPALLRASLDGATAATLSQRPSGEDWSIRDVVLGLTDAELLLAVHVRLALAEDAPLLPSPDAEMWKRRLHYLWRDVDAALALFQLTRYTTGELLSRCDRAQWARTGLLGGIATSVATLVEQAASADRVQTARVSAMRAALGR